MRSAGNGPQPDAIGLSSVPTDFGDCFCGSYCYLLSGCCADHFICVLDQHNWLRKEFLHWIK